jgi:hypothetical protein
MANRSYRSDWYEPPGHRAAARRRGRKGPAAVTVLAIIVVLAVVAGGWALIHHSPSPAGKKSLAKSRGLTTATTPTLPAAESGLLPWHLAQPLSREVVASGQGGRLVVLGGLTASGASVGGVDAIRTDAGVPRYLGSLRAPVHDAAVTVIGGRAVIFGGGSPATVANIQAFSLRAGSGGQRASVRSSLPAPRSDASAVTIGATSYVVGGYDGKHPDAMVLATADGRSFTKVASLAVPVRYPAVAALGGQIFVFGGQAISGPHAGAPVDVIQAINPVRRTVAVIGHLPEPLAGAAAMTLDNELFVVGGESTARQRRIPGVGTTQLHPWSPGTTRATPGSPPTYTVSTIWAFDPMTKRLLRAGNLQVPVSHAGAAVIGSTGWIVGGESGGGLVSAVQMLRPNKAFGTAGQPGAGSPFYGAQLLIADRGNNRLLLMSDTMQLKWKYPFSSAPRDPLHFYFPDDAFFIDHGTAIISNQEQNDTIIKIAYPSGKIIWSYGHPRRAGTRPGFLYEPDDAYLLKNGQISVADANNCRVLVINQNETVAHQIGTNGVCVHHPPGSGIAKWRHPTCRRQPADF